MQYLRKRWSCEGGYREVLVIAVPLVLSTGAWTVQHFVDRMFLSWYSPEAIAAAMPAGMASFAIMSLFVGTGAYVSTFVAQYYGARRYHRIGPSLWQGVYVSVIGGIVMLCFVPFARPIFALVGHDALVQQCEVEYFQILCLGGGPAIAASVIPCFFTGRGRPWPVMWVNCAATLVNLVMDYALIFGKWGFPEMGIMGAGVATVLSSVFSFLLFMVLVSMGDKDGKYNILKGWRPEKDLFMRLMRFGFPSGVQFFVDIAGFTAFIFLIGRLGTVSLAASNIAFNINVLAFMPMLGSGIAISVLVGQYLGRDKPDLAQKSAYSGFHMTLIYMVSIAAAYVLLPDIFVAPFAARADPEEFKEIYGLSVILLRFIAVYSIFDTMHIIFASAIKGAGDTRFVMFMILAFSGLVMVVPTYLAVVVFGYGLMICWVFATVYVTTLGFAFYLRFLNGKWKNMRVIEGVAVARS
ncbi:MAG: MATE family efflux transporter [Deltaproteobacteria bacterium]|nr:MATE family efflux transporter [Deltaproteobacteria bacterium]